MKLISEYVLANRRILNQEQLLLGVLRKQGEEGNKVIGIDKRRQRAGRKGRDLCSGKLETEEKIIESSFSLRTKPEGLCK